MGYSMNYGIKTNLVKKERNAMLRSKKLKKSNIVQQMNIITIIMLKESKISEKIIKKEVKPKIMSGDLYQKIYFLGNIHEISYNELY